MEFRNGMEFLKFIVFYLIFFLNAQAMDLPGLSFVKENPKCKITKDYLYLTMDQSALIKKRFPLSIKQSLVRRYAITCKKERLTGYLLNDQIRTHFQSVLIVLNGQKIVKVIIEKFNEPKKYKAPQKWLDLMFNKKKSDEIQIDSITGATLTSKSILRLIKRAAAYNQI